MPHLHHYAFHLLLRVLILYCVRIILLNELLGSLLLVLQRHLLVKGHVQVLVGAVLCDVVVQVGENLLFLLL